MAKDENDRNIKLTVTNKQINRTKSGNGYMVSFVDDNSANNFANIWIKNIPKNELFDESGKEKPYVNIVLQANRTYTWNYSMKDSDGKQAVDGSGNKLYGKKTVTGAEIEQIYEHNMKDAKFVKESGGSTYFQYTSDIKRKQNEKDFGAKSDIAQKAENQKEKADVLSKEEKTSEHKDKTDKVPSEFENLLKKSQAQQNSITHHILGE